MMLLRKCCATLLALLATACLLLCGVWWQGALALTWPGWLLYALPAAAAVLLVAAAFAGLGTRRAPKSRPVPSYAPPASPTEYGYQDAVPQVPVYGGPPPVEPVYVPPAEPLIPPGPEGTVPLSGRNAEATVPLSVSAGLRLIWPVQEGYYYLDLYQFPALVGRDPVCQLVLDRPEISRRHMQIIFENHQFYVEDCGSENGVFLNGMRLTGRAALMPGQQLQLGSFPLSYELL